jgi:hypothetical protein
MKTRIAWLWLFLSLGMMPTLRADVWDQGTPNDGGTTTQNELVNGSNQLHDLGALPGFPPIADQDWYRIGQPPQSSWEIVIDSLSTNANFAVALQRIGSNGGTVVQSSVGVSSLGFTRSLRWENNSSVALDSEYIRVMATSCSTNCAPTDVYQIRAYETTYAVPRFNNYGGQTTTLIVQNKSASLVTGTIYFWNGTGGFITSTPLSVSAKGIMVLNLTSIPQLVGQSGSITITNSGRLHDLSGKTTAVDSNGFTFDTLMEPRAR